MSVSSPEISPDGKSIVIIVSRVNWDEDRYDSQLVLVDIATGAQRPLTNIRKGLDLPQWSPSGDRLAFLAEAGGGEKDEKKAAVQIFVLPMNCGEPRQITSAPLVTTKAFFSRIEFRNLSNCCAADSTGSGGGRVKNVSFIVIAR